MIPPANPWSTRIGVDDKPCKCGHARHAGRCGAAPIGCPCHEYEPAAPAVMNAETYTGVKR